MLICTLYRKILTLYVNFQTVAWATPSSDANSQRDIRWSFSNSSRASLWRAELIRGAHFHLCAWLLDWYAWHHSRIVDLAGRHFSYFSMNSLCTTVSPYSPVIHNTHWALSESVYPFRDNFAFCRGWKYTKSKKMISSTFHDTFTLSLKIISWIDWKS